MPYMNKDYFFIILVLGYIASSSFLRGGDGERVVLADFVMMFVILYSFFIGIMTKRLYVSPVYLSSIPMLIVFLFSAIFSSLPDVAAVELVIIVFCIVGSASLFNVFSRMPVHMLEDFFKWYVIVVGLIAAFSVLDFVFNFGFFSASNVGGLQGGFRNTGQAGSFYGVHAAICLSLILSGLVPRRFFYIALVFSVFIALLCTLKRAAILGFFSGVCILSIRMILFGRGREKKSNLAFLASGFVMFVPAAFFFLWALENVPEMQGRFEYKYSSDVASDFSDGFIAMNIRSSLLALSDSPLYGVGFNNVVGVYQDYEIHSTYLGVLAYGGILGFLFYVFFMAYLYKAMLSVKMAAASSKYALFLSYMLPMFIGLLVSWSYTTHWRKREFWVLVFIIVLISSLARRLRGRASGVRVQTIPVKAIGAGK
jgi:hypothetical protein